MKVSRVKITSDNSVEEFAIQFLRGRMVWRNVPRIKNVRNFGSIVSMILYKQTPFQVELLIVPHQQSSFTTHRHPDVDTVEYGLSGDHMFIFNGEPKYTQEQMDSWLSGEYDTPMFRIKPTDWHSGHNVTTYSFLSIQKWLNNVEPTSVGLNWEGDLVSSEHEKLIHTNEQDIDFEQFSTKLKDMSNQMKWHMTV